MGKHRDLIMHSHLQATQFPRPAHSIRSKCLCCLRPYHSPLDMSYHPVDRDASLVAPHKLKLDNDATPP